MASKYWTLRSRTAWTAVIQAPRFVARSGLGRMPSRGALLAFLPNDTNFVVQYGFDLEAAPASNSAGCDYLARNEEARAFAVYVRG